jgi:hypothetical protein
MARKRHSRKAKLDRRARSAIVIGLLAFIAFQAGFRYLLTIRPEVGDREFGRKLNDLQAKIAQFPDRPLVLMLGSSRVATGFRPDSLPTEIHQQAITFNFSQVGTGPQLAHLQLYRLLKQGIKPAYVLIEFWAPFWANDGYLQAYLDALNLATLNRSDINILTRYIPKSKHLINRWISAQILPMFASRFVLLSHLGQAWAPNFDPDRRLQNLDQSGWWAPRQTVSNLDHEKLVKHYAEVYGKRLASFSIKPTPDRALQDLIELCHREGITPIVVVLPEGRDFQAIYDQNARATVDKYLSNLRTKTQVVDTRDWVRDDGFSDGHHLLPAGAEQFTQRLGQEVLAPLLREHDRQIARSQKPPATKFD